MTSKLSHALAALPESLAQEQFLWQAVETIVTETGLYFAAVYLLDFNDALFYMRAGSGEFGRILYSQGHRFSIQSPQVRHTILYNQITLIDYAESTVSFFSLQSNEQSLLASLFIEEGPTPIPAPLLVNKKWELFLPLRNETGLRGILGLSSAALSAFTADEILTFQLLADQIGTRIKDDEPKAQ
jgi:GAF domain-containing protein